MRSHSLRGIGTVVLLAFAHSASAQLAPRDSTLTRLIREAISANPGLAAAASRVRAAGARIRPAGALPDPNVMVGVMDLTLPGFAFRQSNFTEVDVQVDQAIPWPGTLAARIHSASALGLASRADAESRRRALISRVTEAYYRLRYVITARETVARQQALLGTAIRTTLAQYAGGVASQSDPLLARAAAARLDADAAGLIADEVVLRANLRALRAVVGRDSIVVEPISLDEASGVAHLADSAHIGPPPDLARHPLVAEQRALASAAGATVEAERLSGRPEFTVTGRYGARPLGADFFSAFIGVRVPLWAGAKQRELVRAAEADAEAATNAVADARVNIQREWDELTAGATASLEQLRILVERVLPFTDAALDAALRDYQTAHTNVANVLSAEGAAYRVRLDVARITSEHLTHLVMLEQFATWEAAP
ncbi:MAG: TolC family protein [Gemmatimonadales bacterium]